MGDIIYALPSIREVMENHGFDGVDIYIPNDKSSGENNQVVHIGGSLMFSRPMFDFIKPLLRKQRFINEIFFIKEEEVPVDCIDFDIIRYGSINTGAGNIPGYYAKAFGLVIDFNKPWLEFASETKESPYDIVIGRTTRYINKSINYELLSDVTCKLGFIGTSQEFQIFSTDFKKLRIEHIQVENALEATYYINQSRLYIGNQSFLFSLAESMKVNRLVESFELVPNVIPTGGKCGEFITTKGLCMQISTIMNSKIECQLSSSPEYHLNHPFLSINKLDQS